MGLLAQLLGLENRGASKGKVRNGPRTVRLSAVRGGHSPDKGRKLKPRHANRPIEVERSGGSYRLIDGVERVSRARAAGRRTIRAYVWESA